MKTKTRLYIGKISLVAKNAVGWVRGRRQWHLRQEMASFAQIAMLTIHVEFHSAKRSKAKNSAGLRLYKKP
jgi:hypothetical protein